MARPSGGPQLIVCGPDTRHGAVKKAGQKKYIWHARWYEGGVRRFQSLGVERTDDPSAAWKVFQAEWHSRDELARVEKMRGADDVELSKLIYLYQEARAPHAHNRNGLEHRCRRIIAFFGDYMLSDVDERLCKAYASTRRSPGTARLELGTLTSVLKFAVEQRHVSWQPRVWRPPPPKPKERVMSRSEIATMARWFRKHPGWRHHAIAVVVAYRTAARIESVMSLGPHPSPDGGHIDLDNELIVLNPEGRAATRKVKPTIPIPRAVRTIVVGRTRRGYHVCADRYGNVPGSKHHGALWLRAMKQLKMKKATPHALRHSRITHLLMAKVPVAHVSKFVGLTVGTLMRTYAHLLSDDIKQVADM